MIRTALTSEFAARRSMWRKNIFNWRVTLTQATTLSPPGAIFKHAEHYFRLIGAAQAAQLRPENGDVTAPGGSDPDDLDDGNDFGGLPDRFASRERQGARQPSANQANVVAQAAPQPYRQRQPQVRRKV